MGCKGVSDDAGGWGANYDSHWEAQYGGWKSQPNYKETTQQEQQQHQNKGEEKKDDEGTPTFVSSTAAEPPSATNDQQVSIADHHVDSEKLAAADTAAHLDEEKELYPKDHHKLRRKARFFASKERARMAAEEELVWARMKVSTPKVETDIMMRSSSETKNALLFGPTLKFMNRRKLNRS
jgi:hypothetical protein